MFDRAASSIIAIAATCAAAATAVFAAGFALYALMLPLVGAAGAAAIVALVAALGVGAYALFAAHEAKEKAREGERAQATLLGLLPSSLGDVTQERPLATLALAALGGFIATRHPRLARDIAAAATAFLATRR